MSTKLLSTSATGIETYELANAERSLVAEIITFGARIHKLFVTDRQGKLVDIMAGFEDAEGYRGENPYFNAVIGRVVNRIGGASFELDGKRYDVYKNNGNDSLHGGKVGFDSRIWTAAPIETDKSELVLTYVSPDGEENYPGKMTVTVKYGIVGNSLYIEYFASTTKRTLCNLTNHAYFNLSGDFSTTVHDHEVYIDSDVVTVLDDGLIATGEYLKVDGNCYDFRTPKPIGKDIEDDFHMLRAAGGYDVNYVLRHDTEVSASAYCPRSGIAMSVITDSPCVQLYTGNFLEGLQGRQVYGKQSAFCFETQKYPNACNIAHFPPITLEPESPFTGKTTFVFSVK